VSSLAAVERRAARTFRSVESGRAAYGVVVEQVDAVQVKLLESNERKKLVAVVLAGSQIRASLLGVSRFATSLAHVDEIQDELLWSSEREAGLVAAMLA
jgi:predicted aspartyl protease